MLSLVGVSRLRLETDATRWFVRGTEVRESYERIKEAFAGISPMNIVVSNNTGNTIADPEVIQALDSFGDYLRERSDVGSVVSIADVLRELHVAVVGHRSDPLPLDRELVEQYFLLLDSSEYFRDFLTVDHNSTNIRLRVDNNSSRALIGIATSTEDWWSRFGPDGVSVHATGIMYEFARAQDRISEGQIRGLIFVFGCIFLVFVLVFGSASVAAVSIGANALPIVAAYGFMGLSKISLDAGTILVGSIAIGIAVDDTVHVVSRFQEERASGWNRHMAMRRALEKVLTPVVCTTATVGAGFAVLAFSSFAFTRNLGVLTASIVVMCLLANVFVVPILLTRRKGLAGGGTSSASWL
jgi:predicted RND superfamily exporter protein